MMESHARGSCPTVATLLLAAVLLGCFASSPGAGAEREEGAPVPPAIFGVHTPWNSLGHFIVTGGELIRDRSFRLGESRWFPVTTGSGKVRFEAEGGDPSPAGGIAYPGRASLTTKDDESLACAYQLLLDRIEAAPYTLRFSSRGVGGERALLIVLVDEKYQKLAPEVIDKSDAKQWKRHSVTFKPTKPADAALVGICVASAGTARIDEVRFSRSEAPIEVRSGIKSLLRELGVRSLRWPGGTDADTLDWRQTIGPLPRRGEQPGSFGDLQTPSFGLHEYLDLCEEIGAQPVIGINATDTEESAAELVEYVLGDPNTPQGKRRAGNGRTGPWPAARLFEIGNEPTATYRAGEQVGRTGADYAGKAARISRAMTARAAALRVPIVTSAVVETALQLADWLPGNTEPNARMLHRWNALALADSAQLERAVQATHGHFYSYFGYEPRDARLHFENLMTAGEVLRRTIRTKLRPLSKGLPLWITEYHVLIESEGKVQPQFTKDFQSGLVIADILMAMIEEDVAVAHLHNLSEQSGFGLLVRDKESWHLRPAGHAFRLVSATAGEKRLPLELNVSGLDRLTYTVKGGIGNIPSGLAYEKVSGIATLDSSSGRPRVLLLNRDFDDMARVEIRIPGYELGDAAVLQYSHDDVAADNESAAGHDTVRLHSSKAPRKVPFVIDVPPHALLRVDFD